MSGHIVWDIDPVLWAVPVSWLRIIGAVAAAGLAIFAGRYFWRGHKRGSEEDKSVGWTLVTILALVLIVMKFIKGPLEIRYYGVLFAAALFCGYYIMRWQFRRGGYGDEKAESMFLYSALGIIIGARLGHVLFYEPDKFLDNPIEILKIWHGGLSSHGTAIGVLFALWLFHRRHKIPYVEVTDRLSMSIALCSSFIRLGNFLNSEIVGRVWDGPWAVVFTRYDNQPRHPSQIYEVLMSWAVFAILFFTDRHLKEERPRGLISSMLIMGYFTLRFVVEFFKEYQVDALVARGSPITMGQALSIPFVLIGLAWFIYAWRKGRYRPEEAEADGEASLQHYRKKKRKKR